jgi:protein-S-isoprenylcysteine O-methyltransferase Ste14
VAAAPLVVAAADQPSAHNVLLAVYWLLRAAVAAAFAAFTVNRAKPHRRAREPLAFMACGVAMFALIALAAPPKGTASTLLIAGDAVAVGGCAWLLASVLSLGRCFGVLPEARGLVTRGPYRLVRHPVYLGEITAVVGLTLAAPAQRNFVVLAVLVAAQIVRSRMEERALSDAFPGYASYAARTGRLLPKVRVAQPDPITHS